MARTDTCRMTKSGATGLVLLLSRWSAAAVLLVLLCLVELQGTGVVHAWTGGVSALLSVGHNHEPIIHVAADSEVMDDAAAVPFLILPEFGFQSKGTAKLKVTATPKSPVVSHDYPWIPPQYHLLISLLSGEVANVLQHPNLDLAEEAGSQRLCVAPSLQHWILDLNHSDTDASDLIATTPNELQTTIPTDGVYTVIILLCKRGLTEVTETPAPSSIFLQVDVAYSYLNRDGIESPLEEIPLLNVYSSITAIYGTFFVAGLSWMLFRQFRKKKPPKRIQWLILIALFLKCVDAALSLVEAWTVRGGGNDTAVMFRKLVTVAAELVFLGTQLMLCRGYSFVYDGLTAKDKQLLIASLLFYGVFRSLYEFDSGKGERLTNAYLYSYVMGRFIITGMGLISLSLTLEGLRKAMIVEDTPGVIHNFLRFTSFWRPYAFYVGVPLLVMVFGSTVLFAAENRYIELLLSELITVYYFLIVMYYFRAKAMV